MNADNLKIKVAQKILGIDDFTLIKQLDAMIGAQEDDFWNELTPEQQSSVLKGKRQIKAGKGKSTKEVMSKYKKWLTA